MKATKPANIVPLEADPRLKSLDDFIIIGEFDEVKGPTPVYVHPQWVGEKGSFDIRRFILRIMAIDFQNRRRNGPTSSGPSVFSVSDTQSVVQAEDYYVYVHHLLLPDARARGHSRAACLCYVTPHEDKPTALFSMLRRYFTKVSELLKLGAYHQFIRDVQGEIDEVREADNPVAVDDDNTDPVENHTNDLQKIVEMASNCLSDLERVWSYRMNPTSDDDESETVHKGDMTNTGSSRGDRIDGETTQQRGSDGSGDGDNRHESRILAPYVGIDNTTGDSRHVFALCQTMVSKVKSLIDYILLTLSPSMFDHYEIQSNAGMWEVNDLGDVMDRRMRHLVSRSSTVTDTHSNTHKHGLQPHSVAKSYSTICFHTHTHAGYEVEIALNYRTDITRHVLQSCFHSFAVEEDPQIVPEMIRSLLNARLHTSAFTNTHDTLPSKNDTASIHSSNSQSSLYMSSADDHSSATDISDQSNGMNGVGTGPTDHTTSGVDRTHHPRHSSVGNIPALDTYSPDDEESEDNPLTASASSAPDGTHARSQSAPVYIYRKIQPDCLHGKHFSNFLRHILIDTFSGFATHLLFSLLCGRPTIVYGKPSERLRIECIVRCLTLFVPTCYADYRCMMLWRDTENKSPLSLLELEETRVMGLSKDVDIPARLIPYITILDVDDNALSAPEYTVPVQKDKRRYESMIEAMLKQGKSWRNDAGILFLEQVKRYLLEITIKSMLYYHLCCVGLDMGQKSLHPEHTSQPRYDPRGQMSSEWQLHNENRHHMGNLYGGNVHVSGPSRRTVNSPEPPSPLAHAHAHAIADDSNLHRAGPPHSHPSPQHGLSSPPLSHASSSMSTSVRAREWREPGAVLRMLGCMGSDVEIVYRMAEMVKITQKEAFSSVPSASYSASYGSDGPDGRQEENQSTVVRIQCKAVKWYTSPKGHNTISPCQCIAGNVRLKHRVPGGNRSSQRRKAVLPRGGGRPHPSAAFIVSPTPQHSVHIRKSSSLMFDDDTTPTRTVNVMHEEPIQ